MLTLINPTAVPGEADALVWVVVDLWRNITFNSDKGAVLASDRRCCARQQLMGRCGGCLWRSPSHFLSSSR